MKKIYFIGLWLITLASCSATNDDLQNLDKNNLNQSASGGFRGGDNTTIGGSFDEELPSTGIWRQGTIPPNPIYGFYSSYTNKHLYNNSPRIDDLPKSYPGLDFYFIDRFLGSANGNGQEITSWFNTVSNDLIVTTNPNEVSGQDNWIKKRNLGKSYNGDEEGSFPIYRYFRNSTKSHFYTKDFNELGNGKFGFVYEGISFYLKDSDPEKYRISDGQFFQDINTERYYITFESKLRLIEDAETVRRLFNFRKEGSGIRGWKNRTINKVNINDYIGPRGKNLDQNTKLIRDTSTGKIYFVEGATLRHIPTPEIFNFYYFRDESVVNSSNLRGFVGKDIAKTYY